MKKRKITENEVLAFAAWLRAEEKSAGTEENYLRHLRRFAKFLDGSEATKERAAAWKDSLLRDGLAPATVNAMLASVNAFFRFAGWEDCRVKSLRLQRQLFRDTGRELSRAEYERLIISAREQGKERLCLILETICATGIRVGELKYITVETARSRRAEISLKGKVRVIMLPGKLSRLLLKYARKIKTASGEIFLTGNGKSLSRKQIWAEMKRLCRAAGVAPGKVFPHNLRHLFARVFYKSCRDMAKLADVLGHSSIETTRLYLMSTGKEHERRLNRLGLVV